MKPLLAHLVFWVLLPLTAAQGLWLRRKAVRLTGASGPRQGSTGSGNRLNMLALGDSIIDGVGITLTSESLPVQFALALARQTGKAVHWQIEGETGLDVAGVLERVDAIEADTPFHLVLLSVGVNDVTGMSSTRHWRSTLTQLLARLDSRWPGIQILFAGIPPMSLFPLPPQPLRYSLGWRATTLDRMAADLMSNNPNAVHAPTRINPAMHGFCEDGFHPNAESCTLWAEDLAAIESRRESI